MDAFLKDAAGGPKDGLNFKVIVAEAAPSCSGHVGLSTLLQDGVHLKLALMLELNMALEFKLNVMLTFF